MKRLLAILKSKTVWGAIFATGGILVKQETIDPADLVAAIGAVLVAVGIKDGQSKQEK